MSRRKLPTRTRVCVFHCVLYECCAMLYKNKSPAVLCPRLATASAKKPPVPKFSKPKRKTAVAVAATAQPVLTLLEAAPDALAKTRTAGCVRCVKVGVW